MTPEQRLARFEQKYTRADTGCWIWHAATNMGYGRFWMPEGPQRAHRMAWVFYRGSIPADKIVCHKCNNPLCVNPDHLYLGTPKTNAEDTIRAGHHGAWRRPDRIARGSRNGSVRHPESRPRGSQHPKARLSEMQVQQIRSAARAGKTHGVIAARFGVSRSRVTMIVNRQAWAHVP